MSATNALETDLLNHLFANADIALVGDATGLRGSSSAGDLYFSLHTADPDEAGDQTTNEISYTSYARVAVARSGSGFTVSGSSVSPAATVTFPACTGGSGTATHFGIGTAASSTGKLLFKGAISPTIAISSGVTPQLTTATAITAD
jgi:hypothetical protein